MNNDSSNEGNRQDVLRRNLRTLSNWAVDAASQLGSLEQEIALLRSAKLHAPTAAVVARRSDPPAASGIKKGRACVISWDLGHNPAGRAIVLYDLLERDWNVELIGPLWKRFGGSVWKPILNGQRKVRAFACERMEQFWPAALAMAASSHYDLVVVCKPRLPSLVLGALIKERSGCPLVLDVDDFELSFFKNETTASLDDLAAALPQALSEPYEELATRACDGLIRDADAVIVSNAALRRRFGGHMVRHARDEDTFRTELFDRGAERRRMGIAEEDFAIIFVGTPRPHKGIFTVAETLAAMPDKRFVLHVVADADARTRKEFERFPNARVVLHPGCDFDLLPNHIVAADAVVLLQDPTHPISQYQIPAKISDATAFGLPVLTTDVPPLRDLAHQGLLTQIAPVELAVELTRLMKERQDGGALRGRSEVRAMFEAELGFRINRERLDLAIQKARAAPSGIPASYARLIDLCGSAFAALARANSPDRPAAAPVGDGIDLVVFWKQNDTGIYGRRPDMLMRYLLKSGRVRRILQFDAPLEIGELARLAEKSDGPTSAAGLVLRNTVANQFALRDRPNHMFRTFLWDRRQGSGTAPQAESLHGLAHLFSRISDYPAYVRAQMDACGMRPEDTFAWVCPVVFNFPDVAREIPFRGIIGDIIDDQREFEARPEHRRNVENSYLTTLPLFDVTFTNCEPVARAFRGLVQPIHIVPNGTELITATADSVQTPAIFAKLRRPIAGYVGNLRDRIDWSLLRHAAMKMPHVTFLIIGDGARPEDVAFLSDLPNVVLPGVVPYEHVMSYIAEFDVALVPHRKSVLTERMNPLKIYNYFSARRPVVSTEVANIDPALARFIRFASSPEEFTAAVEAALSSGIVSGPDYDAALAEVTWDNRAAAVLRSLDEWIAKGTPARRTA